MILVTDYSSLTDDLQEVFNEAAKRKVAEMTGAKIFEVRETDRRTYDYLVLHGLSGVKKVTPGQDLPTVSSAQGDSVTWTQVYHGARFLVTDEMRRFDLYDQIKALPRTLVDESFDKIDQSYADVLLFGFSATSYTNVFDGTTTATSPDAVALFSASHTNNINSDTFRNLIRHSNGTANPNLSRDAIVTARKDAMVSKDPSGLVRPVNLDTLLVAPTNEDLAERIIFSNQQSGTANNDTNPLKGKIRQVVTWPRLETRSDSTDTSAYWFMCDSAKSGETLKSKFAKRPSLEGAEQTMRNKNWEYTVDFYYTTGIGFPVFVWGSTGANVI